MEQGKVAEIPECKIPLAYHEICMYRAERERRMLLISFSAVIVLIVALFVFLWLQYDYVSVEETSQTGVYVLSDSEGNVIASDADADQIIDLLKGVGNGESYSQEDANS